MSTLPPFPKQYSVEFVRSDERQRTLLYVDGGRQRTETILPDGDIIEIVIVRPDKGYLRSFDPLNKTYKQVKLPKNFNRAFDPEKLFEWSEDGFETIDKRKCRRFVGRLRTLKNSLPKAREICFVDFKTGMRRRMVGYDTKGKEGVIIDYLNAKIGPPPRKLFEMLEGYKRGYWK